LPANHPAIFYWFRQEGITPSAKVLMHGTSFVNQNTAVDYSSGRKKEGMPEPKTIA